MTRSADTVLALVAGIDVVNNFAFQAHRRATANAAGGFDPSPLLTFCNCYLTSCTAALCCPVPPMLANKQHAWLKSNEGMLAGWMHVDSETARQRAELGYPTIAAATNPAGHGHVGLVVPADPTGQAGVYVSSAGLQNYVRAPLARSFGVLRAEFFTHD